MNSDSAYTPLESLLLFQALRAESVDSISFNRISEQLKSIPAVRNDRRFDSGRLSPDALRELYLTLLKDEVKRDLELQANGDNHLTNGDVSPGSRKRKTPSPSLPTVSEATKHSHLIPQLVTRLYTGFRKHYVETTIQPLEKRYANIQEEISEIEAGQWDERLQKQQTQSPRPSSTAHTQPVVARADQSLPSSAAVASPAVPHKQVESSGQGHVKRYSQAKIDAVINHGPEPQNSPVAHQRHASNTSLPPLAEVAPHSPRHGIPPNAAGVPPPMQPMQHVPHHGYTQSPPGGHQSPYPPQNIHPRSGSVGSPQVQQSLSRASSSPRPILPPPKGMQYSPGQQMPHTGSPGLPHQQMPHQHPQAHQQHYPQQPRMPSGPSPTGEMTPRAYPGTPLAPHPAPGYYPPHQQPYANRRPSYNTPVQGHQTPTYPTQAPHPGGYMLPPFQIQSQDHARPVSQQQQQPLRPHQPHMPAQRPVYPSHGHVAPATGPRHPPLPPNQMPAILAALATPPRPRFQQPRPLWKPQPFDTPVGDQTPKPRPQIEPLSPTLGRAKSPVRSTRATRTKEAPTIEEPTPTAEPASKSRTSKRRANARDRSPHSVVSSIADESLLGRTRSQSVSTVAGAHPPSEDRPRSRNGVKAEASTPSNMLEEAEPAAGSSASGKMTRTRRGTLSSQAQPSNKRKRQESPSESAVDASTPPPRSNTVIATRNFAKMSSAVMNDITSHKHASYFAKEVRDKDAPGYSEIVKQPQNLKAIRSAITAGGRAIAAATVNADSPAATPSASSSTTVELERTADLIPPKAIVNGAQLEKELMRMLANAYMFNPGEDGMALSTKEMFEDVEQKISEWRGTEREAGGDEEEDAKGKRRKI